MKINMNRVCEKCSEEKHCLNFPKNSMICRQCEAKSENRGTHKVCSKCKKTLPLQMFGRDKTKKDGLKHQCKHCIKSYNSTKARAYHTENYIMHIDVNSDNIEERQTAYRKISKMKRALHETTA